jgi:hypothetical protein
LNYEIKKINLKKQQKKNSSQLRLTCETRGLSHEININS